MQSGRGVCTWPSGARYEGEWKDDKRSGRGVHWLRGGQRVFDGEWAAGFPLRGTAMEPDGTLFRVTFDGETLLSADSLDKAIHGDWAWIGWRNKASAGRVAAGGSPPQGGDGGPPPAWRGRVELGDGTVVVGTLHGLRLRGPATVVEPSGATYAAEYDGVRTLAEGPVPVRTQVRRARVPSDG